MALSWIVRNVPGVARLIGYNSGLRSLAHVCLLEAPTLYPIDHITTVQANTAPLPASSPWTGAPGMHVPSVHDYRSAYESGKITPLQVATALIAAIERDERDEMGIHPMRAYDKHDILKQAAESTARYVQNRPLGPLDGVPIGIFVFCLIFTVGVKDGIDMMPYPTGIIYIACIA